ncbi:triacylglycerol lipase-like protein [Trichocladium antarcticum]|uniref:Triacylglycerol lipase-like protein n=1 Tax=Trichocladium antarcticum TaxID=1450529 RepID=A0AAN6ZFU5_9PEZI|nr:triacylglycerol lipase-like protein [Trichocladium antarcticum]
MSEADAAALEAAAAAARTSTITLWTLFAFGVIITALRTFARVKAVGTRFEADDYLVWVAILFYAAQSTLGWEIGNLAHGMANNAMTPAQRAALLPTDPEYDMRVVGSKIQVAGWASYATLMLALKLAMLFFYLRLTNGLGRRYRLRVHIGFAIIIAGYLASVLSIFASCRPFHRYWQIHPDPTNSCEAAVSRPLVWTSFGANISSDLYLIMIPIPLLWGSRLRLVEKIASTLVLCAGIFVLVCATVKTAFILSDKPDGAAIAGDWGTREAFVAVATTNLPMVFPLFKTWLRPLIGSSARTTNDNYNKKPDGFRSIGGGGADDSHSRRTRGTNPLTHISFTESEERIVNEIKLQNMKVAAAPVAPGTQPGPIGKKGIVVKTEFDIQVSEDGSSQHHAEQKATCVHEPW